MTSQDGSGGAGWGRGAGRSHLVTGVLLGNVTLGKLRFFGSLREDKILRNGFGA